MRCKKGFTHPPPKTGQCVSKKNRKTNTKKMKYKSNKTTTTNKNMASLSLTKENLIVLGLKPPEPVPAPVPEKTEKIKKERKMSDNVRQKNIDWYNSLMQDYISYGISDIYERLKPIAQKKYSKDERLAEIQERFYHDFIDLVPNEENIRHHDTFVENLQKMREKANRK